MYSRSSSFTVSKVSLDRDLFTIRRGEARYRTVGEFVARELPERSLFLTMQHSGSLRYYGRRTTLRYDWIPP